MARKTAKRRFKCPKCDRTFSMAAHLARHMSSHGVKTVKNVTKKKVGKRRTYGIQKGKHPGRPAGVATRHGLGRLTLEQLTELISAASAEAQRRIVDLKQAVQ